MPLPTANLDNRSYQQFLEDMLRRIPIYAPEWSDHSPSDPGITLIELFAFLGEALLYRFNQIPQATQLAFLRLLDMPLKTALPARGFITVEPDGKQPVEVKQGTEARSGNTSFECQQAVMAYPLEVRGLIKA